MKFEQDLLRASGTVPMTVPAHPNPFRRAAREVTDVAINDALLMNRLPELCSTLAACVLIVAEGLIHHSKAPGTDDFVGGTQSLIEEARTILDRGLMLGDWPQALRGAVMIELVVRGAMSALGLPYEDIVREVHAAHTEDREADMVGLLTRLGRIANEGQPS